MAKSIIKITVKIMDSCRYWKSEVEATDIHIDLTSFGSKEKEMLFHNTKLLCDNWNTDILSLINLSRPLWSDRGVITKRTTASKPHHLHIRK